MILIDRRFEAWKGEMIWLTGYFSTAVWLSLYLESDSFQALIRVDGRKAQ